MKRYNVRFPQKIGEIDISHIQRQARRVVIVVISQQPATKAFHDMRQRSSDLTGAYNSDRFPSNVEADQPFEVKIAFTDAVVCVMDVPVQGKHQSDRMLGNGLGGSRPARI
jgi:hypothetical protein